MCHIAKLVNEGIYENGSRIRDVPVTLQGAAGSSFIIGGSGVTVSAGGTVTYDSGKTTTVQVSFTAGAYQFTTADTHYSHASGSTAITLKPAFFKR